MSPRRSTPRISIVTPVYDPPIDVLRACIESVLAQDFEDWELILVDDLSPHEAVPTVIAEYARDDDRVRLIERDTNGHIVAASNDGVDAARGEFIALLDHDDLLAPAALSRVVEEIDRHDDVDYVYTDEDKVGEDGRSYGTFHKPDWSPERLRGQMYTSHLSVLRTELVREVGAFREGFDGSQDHDLVLRVTERARRVVHVPEVLYHWRAVEGSTAADIEAKPYADDAGVRAVQEHLDRLGIAARALSGAEPGRYEVRRALDPGVRVSLVVPTMGQSAVILGESRVLVVEAIRSALARTDHADVEVVVVHDAPDPALRPRPAARGRGRPPGPRALRRALQLQHQDEPRRQPRVRGPCRLPQRRRRGHLAGLARAAGGAAGRARRRADRLQALLRRPDRAARRARLLQRRLPPPVPVPHA